MTWGLILLNPCFKEIIRKLENGWNYFKAAMLAKIVIYMTYEDVFVLLTSVCTNATSSLSIDNSPGGR